MVPQPRSAMVRVGTHRTTLRGNQARLEMAAAGGADRRSAKNVAAPMNQSREALLAAWPRHSPEGASRRRLLRPTGPTKGHEQRE